MTARIGAFPLSRYTTSMMTLAPLDPARRRLLAAAIRQVLEPVQLTMVHELLAAEKPGCPAPQPEEILFWMRLNMPVATAKVDDLLHLAE